MADEGEAEAEKKLKAKFGALPNQKALMERRMRGEGGKERKYFDSADWAKDLSPKSTPPGAPPGDSKSEAAAGADAANPPTQEPEPDPERPPPIR